MMSNYLYELAKMILFLESRGLSKVKLAKVIYFVHKSLVVKGLSEPGSLRFIRMPLGPVPVGFMNLTEQGEDIVTRSEPSGLSYDSVVYKLSDGVSLPQSSPEFDCVKVEVQKLASFSTSYLVELSHRDESWISHANGEEYIVAEGDLKNLISGRPRQTLTPEVDAQRLQASLLEGMLGDVVEQSTEIEYPKTAE